MMAVRGHHPPRIDLVHPVMRLTKRIVGITRARPMAECGGRRKTCFARVDVAAVFRSDPAEIEDIDVETAGLCQRVARDLDDPIGFSTSHPAKYARCATNR